MVRTFFHTMHIFHLHYYALLALLFLPKEIHAQTITAIFTAFTSAFNDFVLVVFGIAFVVFVWSVVQFMRKAGNDAEVSKARAGVLWATFGLFFIASIWGIVAIMRTLTGVEDITECKSPSVGVDDDGKMYTFITCE